jgi:hypothetical protein
MIPDADEIFAAYPPIAKQLGFSPRLNENGIRVALREAEHLANDIYDVPAALLFAFGKHPRCFNGFRTMSVLIVQWQAKRLGFKLEATCAELADVVVRVARNELSYNDVGAWVVERMLPFAG